MSKFRFISQEELDDLYKESSNRLKEIHILRNEIKELHKKLYPFSMCQNPKIMDLHMERVVLELALSVGEYRDSIGNHIVIKDFTDKKQEYKYFIDDASFRSREYAKKIIENFFTDLMIKYTD